MTMIDSYSWPLRRFADRVAVTTRTVERTFREVDDRANALANAFIELGVTKGDVVGMLVGNEAEYLETEIAIAKAGAVRAPMLAISTHVEIVQSVLKSGASWLVVESSRASEIRELMAGLEVDHGRAVSIIVIGDPVDGLHAYEDLIAGSSDAAPKVEVAADDPWAIRFTGGTTGLPKAVLMSHRSGMTMVNNMLINWSIGSGDRTILDVHPLSHAAGLTMATFYVRGNRNVMLPAFGFDPKAIYETIERERVNALFLVPTGVISLLDFAERGNYDTSSLEHIIYGGAPMPPARIREANQFFGPVLHQVYGASETPMVCSTMLPEDHVIEGEAPPHLASAGRPAFNVDIKLVDADGVEVPRGDVGEIVVRGDHVFSGYVNDPEITAKRLRDGWVYTNDLARWGDDGYIYIVDRKEDMIITGGFNVYPVEVEAVLGEHPDVAEAVVIGVADDYWGEAVVGVVVAKEGRAVSEAELIAFARQRLGGVSTPKRVVVRDEPLPKSGVGKLLRRSVRDEYSSLPVQGDAHHASDLKGSQSEGN